MTLIRGNHELNFLNDKSWYLVIKLAENQKLDIEGEHPAPFPEEISTLPILQTSKEFELVLDPFMGSGTTGVAAKKLSRNFIGIELDEGYFQIAKDRIEAVQLVDDMIDIGVI